MFENRRWLIIPTSLTSSIDFTQVLESSPESLRLSVDGSKTFVKYEINEVTASYEEYYPDAEEPNLWHTSSIEAGVYGRPFIYQEGDLEYTHKQMLDILTGSEWVEPFEDQV